MSLTTAVRGLGELAAGSVVLWLAVVWGLVQSMRIRLLAMLHLGFLWLGLALLLSGASQLLGLRLGVPVLGLGTLHALTMGALGSLLMAMVTRVACGHSGRTLVADDRVWALFWLLQVAVLLPALDATDAAIQEGALTAILERRSRVGQAAIVGRLHRINDRWKQIIDKHRGHLSQSLRDALVASDEQMMLNGCQGAVWFKEYDLAPTLIKVAEDSHHAHADLAAQTMLKLCDLLYDELAGPRDYSNRRDPQVVRRFVAGVLETAAKRYPTHHRMELVEGFLLLSGRDNAALKQLLREPLNPVYTPVMN